jgi:hypothetical protein
LVARFGSIKIVGGALFYATGIGWLIVTASRIHDHTETVALLPPLVLAGFRRGLPMTPLFNRLCRGTSRQNGGGAHFHQLGSGFCIPIVGIFFVSILGNERGGGTTKASHYAAAFSGAML